MKRDKTAAASSGLLQLSDQNIIDLQRLYKEHLGKVLTRTQAQEKGVALLTVMELIYKPMTHEEHALTKLLRAKLATTDQKTAVQKKPQRVRLKDNKKLHGKYQILPVRSQVLRG